MEKTTSLLKKYAIGLLIGWLSSVVLLIVLFFLFIFIGSNSSNKNDFIAKGFQINLTGILILSLGLIPLIIIAICLQFIIPKKMKNIALKNIDQYSYLLHHINRCYFSPFSGCFILIFQLKNINTVNNFTDEEKTIIEEIETKTRFEKQQDLQKKLDEIYNDEIKSNDTKRHD